MGSFISLHREGYRTPPSPNFPKLFTPTESHWLKGRSFNRKPFLSPQLSRMKSCMRDCLPAVLLRNITSVMDDLKATDGSADYLGEKLCLEKKFCRWLSMLREPFREQHSSACWPCLCQAAHTTFYIQSPPPPTKACQTEASTCWELLFSAVRGQNSSAGGTWHVTASQDDDMCRGYSDSKCQMLSCQAGVNAHSIQSSDLLPRRSCDFNCRFPNYRLTSVA